MKGPIVCDIAGTELTDDERRRIAHPLVGMVILFTRNYKDREQLARLCREIHEVGGDVLISVDHEGGRVQRFRDGFTEIAAMRSFGQLYDKNPDEALKRAINAGYVLASELRSCGVDFTFAPVLDLDWQRCDVIGARSFSVNPSVVARLAGAISYGFSLAGMANCGKHFPGHGWVRDDSHLALPVDERTPDRLLNGDTKPYAMLGVGLASVMTAHVVYPEIDNVAATFSRRIITDILRGDLKFDGLVFSDDLSMQGAKSAGTVVDRAQKALAAGCDALIVCNSPADTDELIAGLKWEKAEQFVQRAARLAPKGDFVSFEELSATALYQRALEGCSP